MRYIAICFYFGISISLIAAIPTSVWSAVQRNPRSILQGVHGDRSVLPKSCRSCHRGMQMAVPEEQVCLDCHGSTQVRKKMIDSGYLRETGQVELKDIGADLRKPYSHPVLSIRGVHQRGELLPEDLVNAARHSECFDCHEAHQVDRGRPYAGIPGRRIVNIIVEVEKEYELCYKCHAESANLPASSTNKHMEFKTTNPSYHPVEGEGANAYVISLKEPYRAREERAGDISRISCTDCHGSDDPQGPKGPHGSNYQGLLVRNYEMRDGFPESEYAYELCYSCHDRASILGNESFPLHSLHIQGSGMSGAGTTCFACHDAHGSTQYQYLIRFNRDVVGPNAENKLEYKAQGVASRHGSCSLNCHGVEHVDMSY